LLPTRIEFISYPYEWSFSQLKDAALRTLDIQELSLNQGMTLKDAPAYNIQFVNRAPVFIDTLYFEIYDEGHSLDAFRQFCQHFLAPLALMVKNEVGATTIAFDIDPAAVDINYRILKDKTVKVPLPLLLDLTIPTPGLGWNGNERDSLLNRRPSYCIMAIALIHHLAILNNVPLERIASFFAEIGHNLIFG
jgi:hypothetical protein